MCVRIASQVCRVIQAPQPTSSTDSPSKAPSSSTTSGAPPATPPQLAQAKVLLRDWIVLLTAGYQV